MSELTGHSSGWFFQNPKPSGHCPVGGAVVVVTEMLVVVVEGLVLDVVVDEVVVAVGRVVVVVVEVVGLMVVTVVEVVVGLVVVVGRWVVVVADGVVVEVTVVELVVGGRVVVVVVDGGSVAVDVVVVAMVVLVVDVVVDPVPITDTLQPVPVAGRIAVELVSKRVFTVRPMAVVALAVAVAATPKVIMATLTTPVGDVRLALWKAERLVVPGVGVFVVGLPENSAVFPPETDASVRTAGSYVTAIE